MPARLPVEHRQISVQSAAGDRHSLPGKIGGTAELHGTPAGGLELAGEADNGGVWQTYGESRGRTRWLVMR